uniref:DUF4371 domain-containing protein n=1 Tax=Panagrolaimus sp. ES5 TaxID=591445 RepID=A0AC34FVM7_9BILA
MKPIKWLFLFILFIIYLYCNGEADDNEDDDEDLGDGCKIRINEVLSNMYTFDSKHENYDFVEISVRGSLQAPNLNPYLILYVQLNHSSNPNPLLLQSISLYQQSVRHHRHGRIFNGFLIYGVASDGASVMVGIHGGLKALFKTFTSNPFLTHIHCYAHRLELCINKAFNKVVLGTGLYLQRNLTTSINGLSDFYGSRAVKRKAELVELCRDMNIKMYKLKRIFYDVFQIIQKYSLAYQLEAAVLPGQKLESKKLKIKLRELREDDGRVMTASLNRIKCTINYGRVQSSKKCTKYVYDSNLRAADNVILFLDHKVIKKAALDLSSNAAAGTVNPFGNDPATTVSTNEINDDMDDNHIGVQMEIDESDGSESDDESDEYFRFQFIQYDRSDPDNWPKTAEADDIIDLSDELFDFLASSLTVPVGSADAERGFSILFHTLDSRRSRLNISTIDNILNIRINGPPINKFVCYKFVEDWKKVGHLQSDAQQARGKGRKKNNVIKSDDSVENLVKDEETKKRWERRYEIFIPDPFLN